MRLLPLHDPLPAGIEIHRLDLSLDAHEAREGSDAWRVLSPDEQSHARRFARHADRARFVQARAAARGLLAARLACRAEDVPLRAGAQGKPLVEGDEPGLPLFNVSHSGRHALIAIADPRHVTHVGIDIEEHRRELDVEDILPLAFTERESREVREARDMRDAAGALHAFYARWVGKEAVLKAVGVGMSEHLRCIGIHPAAGAHATGGIHIACDVAQWRGFEAMALPAPPGYAAALAWQTKEPT